MNNLINKTKFSTIFLIFLFSISIILGGLPVATAHDPAIDVPTYAYIEVTPDPVGINQQVFVIMWINWPPVSAAGEGGDRWTGYTVKITKPDGSIDNLGPYVSDATSSTFTTYIPDQIGDYTFDFNFPGQVASLYHPISGIEGSNSVYIGDYFEPSSASTTITVQEDPVLEPPNYPEPTEYWTRPIEGQNTEWATISSNYLNPFGAAYRTGSQRFQPDGAAPNSPHIMWTKPLEDGGVVGGEFSIPGAGYYTGLSYESRFNTPIIMHDRLYYDTPLGDDPRAGPYVCVDLRTGETLWENDDISPTFGQLYLYESFNQHGVITGYLWQETGERGAPTVTWDAYDSRTGEWLFELTNVPAGTNVYESNGAITRYIMDYENNQMGLWTTEALPTSPLVGTPGTSSSAYQYRPVGKIADMSENYLWTATIPNLPEDSSILAAIPNDILIGNTPTIPPGARFGTNDPVTVWAISLKPENRGDLLWSQDYPAPEGFLTRQLGPVDADTRVFTMNDKETMQWLGYDLDSGDLIWGPVGETRDFNYYPTIGMGGSGQAGFVAYGNLYVGGYGGEYFCYDLTDGDLLWKYDNTASGTQTPWGNYPIFPAAIADGKVYLYSGEHSPNTPLYKGSMVRCLDAFNGNELWTMMGWGDVGSFADEGWPVAGGYISYLNAYDGQVYCIGKGPSKTTVTVQDDVISKGESILVKGMVTDEAAGTKQQEQMARFPNGVPAVSDESMAKWMEYVYMQKPCPESTTGVQVKLVAVDSNGNSETIGTVTSDGYGMFKKMWTPENEGEYTITATFEGSASYYTSYAQTAIGVGAVSSGTPIEPENTMITTEVAIIAAVAVAAVIGVAAYWFIKRK